MAPLTRGRAAAEAPTLLDTLARAPGAAALVVAALGKEDRGALRLAHRQLRDAVDEVTNRLWAILCTADAARPPTALRWPLLKRLAVYNADSAGIQALGPGAWLALHYILLDWQATFVLDASDARALAARLQRAPALRQLYLGDVEIPASAAAVLFRHETAPRLRELSLGTDLTPTTLRMLAATGWPLEELGLSPGPVSAAGFAALAAAPTFALRKLSLSGCKLDAASLLVLAAAPWPLEELDLSDCDLSDPAAAPALAAFSRYAGLFDLTLNHSRLSAAGFKAVVEAAWPRLFTLQAQRARAAFDGPHALGAASFAGCPGLGSLDLSGMRLGEAGARWLASLRWAELGRLYASGCRFGDAGLAALARGEFPLLEGLDLNDNGLSAPLTLEDARRWAPKLRELEDEDDFFW